MAVRDSIWSVAQSQTSAGAWREDGDLRHEPMVDEIVQKTEGEKTMEQKILRGIASQRQGKANQIRLDRCGRISWVSHGAKVYSG